MHVYIIELGCLGLTEIFVQDGDLFFVTVGIREERVGIDDAFVEDDFVSLGFFDGGQGFRVGVSFDLVRVVHSDFSRVFFGLRDFVDDVLFEDFVIQLSLPARVEGEPAYLAFDFALMGLVPVILGASGSEFDDVIVGFEFAGEFAEMIS